MWTKGLSLLLPRCRSWAEHVPQSEMSHQDVSEPGILNKQRFFSGTVRANDGLDKQNISSEFVPNDFQAKKGGTCRKNRLKVGEDPCLTLALWERCSCEVMPVAVLGHEIQTYL